MISTDRLADAVVDVADTLVDDFDLIDFLHSLVLHAEAISGADAVGLMLGDRYDRLRFMAGSNETAEVLELFQLQRDEGPCIDCCREGRPVVNADLASDTVPWPRFAPAAVGIGFRSVHAFPLRLRGETIGALNLFNRADNTLAPGEARIVQALADVATIGLLQERTISQSHALSEQLQGALNSRTVIEQAKGAIAQQEGTSPAEAFQLLRSQARSSRRRLVDVAREVLDGLGGTT